MTISNRVDAPHGGRGPRTRVGRPPRRRGLLDWSPFATLSTGAKALALTIDRLTPRAYVACLSATSTLAGCLGRSLRWVQTALRELALVGLRVVRDYRLGSRRRLVLPWRDESPELGDQTITDRSFVSAGSCAHSAQDPALRSGPPQYPPVLVSEDERERSETTTTVARERTHASATKHAYTNRESSSSPNLSPPSPGPEGTPIPYAVSRLWAHLVSPAEAARKGLARLVDRYGLTWVAYALEATQDAWYRAEIKNRAAYVGGVLRKLEAEGGTPEEREAAWHARLQAMFDASASASASST